MEEERHLLRPRNNTNKQNDLSEEEWSDSSGSSSYYSDSDSSVPEWETSIEDNGQLLFIDCHPFVKQTNIETENKVAGPLTKTQTRKSTRGKFLRLIRRRDSKRRSKRYPKTNEQTAAQENKVTFQDYEQGEIKEVFLKVENNGHTKLGRRATLVEILLGISTSVFPDESRIMIAGFVPDSEAMKNKNIKIGDCLKSINGIEISAHNLNAYLEQMNKDEVKLQLQCVTAVEVTKQPPSNELSNRSSFVKQLTSNDNSSDLLQLLLAQPVGVLYLNMDGLTENGPEFEGIEYCYPTPLDKNSLCLSRGVFITINHLLQDVTKTKPRLTTVLLKNRLTHIVYKNYGSKLMLFMLPDNRVTAKEVMFLNSEIARTLVFMYGSIDLCFSNTNKVELDHFFSRVFARVLTSGLWNKAEQSIVLNNFSERASSASPFQFEDVLPMAHLVVLPNEAQMQIDDALSELEASDYREWNEDPLDCQRLFTILGSALYHSGYLLATHFIHGDLVDIHLFCRQQGIFHLSRTEPVRSLVLWREVYPHSCKDELPIPDTARRYLLIIGSGKDLLVVLMEAGGCTEPAENNIGPDAFYVEEAQATLAHIQELGIIELADKWLLSNPGTQVTVPEPPATKRKSDFLSNINISKLSKESSPSQSKKQLEVTSILKRRSSDQGPLSQSTGSVFSIPDDTELQSEDSVSQGGYSERSEVSDEPVLGRRAQREKTKSNLDNSTDDDESDIEDYRDGSQISNSSYDLSELRHSLLSDAGDMTPMRLTAGSKMVLFHYVQLDVTEGVLLCPPDTSIPSPTLDIILNNFRNCTQSIHKLFQKTLRFKDMPPQDMAKSVMNKSLIAIKEYGTLFECNFQEENLKKAAKISYWVIGRLFYMPHPREVYVCYQDNVPQNLIEIAFRLNLSLTAL